MKFLLFGASGPVGASLRAALGDAGIPFEIASRQGGSGAHSWNPAEGTWSEPLERVAGACDVWVNLSGSSVADGRLDPAHEGRLISSRVRAVTTLAALHRKIGRPAVRFLHVSATGFYGDCGDDLVDETRGQGTGVLARVCRTAEEAAFRLGEEVRSASGSFAILRLGVVMGAGLPAFERLALPIRWGFGGPLGDGSTWWTWLTAREAGNMLRFLGTSPSLGSSVYNLCSPEPLRQKELGRRLARGLRRPFLLPAPRFALELALGRLAKELLFTSCRASPVALAREGYVFLDPAWTPAVAAGLLGEESDRLRRSPGG